MTIIVYDTFIIQLATLAQDASDRQIGHFGERSEPFSHPLLKSIQTYRYLFLSFMK